MELKNPKSKSKHVDFQPAFPIFIESELGISLENWIPIVCTGVFNGANVVVRSPGEISALYNMGNFGKGSNSRSRPNIVRNNLKIPSFIRQRQYNERMKWLNKQEVKKPSEKSTNNENSEVVKELHSLFKELLKNNIIRRDNNEYESTVDCVIETQNVDRELLKKSENLNIAKYCMEFDKNVEISENDLNNLKFPNKSVIILPDSDNEKDDYFEDIKPKLCIDESDLCETLILSLEEAYFLSFGLGCLQIVNESGTKLTLEESWNLFCQAKPNFFINFAVYHHFRSKGWIVKPGIKFGGDFCNYLKNP